jgi:hypothetical protein
MYAKQLRHNNNNEKIETEVFCMFFDWSGESFFPVALSHEKGRDPAKKKEI